MGDGRDATGLATPVVSPRSSRLDSLRLHAVGVRILGGHVDARSRQQATPPQTAGLEDHLLKSGSAPGLFPEHPELLPDDSAARRRSPGFPVRAMRARLRRTSSSVSAASRLVAAP